MPVYFTYSVIKKYACILFGNIKHIEELFEICHTRNDVFKLVKLLFRGFSLRVDYVYSHLILGFFGNRGRVVRAKSILCEFVKTDIYLFLIVLCFCTRIGFIVRLDNRECFVSVRVNELIVRCYLFVDIKLFNRIDECHDLLLESCCFDPSRNERTRGFFTERIFYTDTALDVLMKKGFATIGVGKIYDIFAGKGVSETYRTGPNKIGMEKTDELFEKDFEGWGVPHFWVKGKLGKVELTAGTFYEQFGSGFILRTYEERSLGIDNSLLGGRVVVRPFKGITLKALTGVQRRYWGWNKSLVSGTDVEISLAEYIPSWQQEDIGITLGGSWVNKYEDKPAGFAKDTRFGEESGEEEA